MELHLEQSGPTAMQLVNPAFDIRVDRPTEKGGHGTGLMGGHYLLIGIAGCFCSTLLAAATSRSITLTGLSISIAAVTSEGLPKRFTDIRLTATCEHISDPEQLGKLLKIAEQGCLSINTIKQGMTFSVEQT